jgi:hypothetical protein
MVKAKTAKNIKKVKRKIEFKKKPSVPPPTTTNTIEKKKRRQRHRWAPKSEWKTYIVRVANAEGFRIHGDSTEIINYLINWWIDNLAKKSLNMLKQGKTQTYNRNTIRAATASMCMKKTPLAKFALEFESGCFRRFDEQDYVIEEDSN